MKPLQTLWNVLKKVFLYLEPLWTGIDGKVSLKSTAAIALIVDFISNLSHSIYKWDVGHSMEGLSLVLGIEAGLIAALLGLTAYANLAAQKIDSAAAFPSQDTQVKIQNVEQVTVTPKPDNPDAK